MFIKSIYPLLLVLLSFVFYASECKEGAENNKQETVKENVAQATEQEPKQEINTPGLNKLFNSTWRLASFNDDKIDYELYGERAFILRFNESKNYEFSLDVNSCVGSLQADDRGSIKFEMPGCTELCCDSEFAMQVANAFSKIQKYRILQLRNLVLLGDNTKLLFDAAEE